MYHITRTVGRALLDGVAPVRCAACGECGSALCEGCVAAIDATPRPLLACARAAFAYEGEVRAIVHHGKFRDCRAALHALAWMGAARLEPPAAATITAVPLTTRRLRQRGYNQAQIVADAVARFHRLPVRRLLRRTGEAPPQSTLHRRGRLANAAGAFAASGDVTGLGVWLVDDVLTTGATSRAATRALLEAGAAGVEVVVLAAVL